MDNIEDWCISRQIWWGHRIPIWYDSDDNVYMQVIVKKKSENFTNLMAENSYKMKDVLDTWFSSSLWPFASLGWPEKTEDFKRHFPTSFSLLDLILYFSGLQE